MRFYELPPLLDAAFGNRLPSGISLPAEPVAFEEIAKACSDSDDEWCEVYDDLWDNLEKKGWSSENLVTFYWQSGGPMLFDCRLELLSDPEGRRAGLVRLDRGVIRTPQESHPLWHQPVQAPSRKPAGILGADGTPGLYAGAEADDL